MTRENIINLARECGADLNGNDSYPRFTFFESTLEAFYHKAQAEAFERAYNAADNAYATEDVLLAIREMAKEMK